MALPKAIGGWGLKNLFLFSKTLVAKNVWRVTQGIDLWVQVVRAKYISPNTMEDWIRNPFKQQNNASIIWKVGIYDFHLVGNWLIWQIGKGDKLQIGFDPWAERKGMCMLPF